MLPLPGLSGPAVSLGSLLLDNVPANLALAVLYILATVFTGVRLFRRLCAKSRPPNLSRSFLAACFSSLLLRSISFLAISILAIRTHLRTDFLERLVGSGLGASDWLTLTAFLLGIKRYIAIVYACRHHLLNKKKNEALLRGLLISFTILLVLTAIGLYAAVFATQASPGSPLANAIQLALSIVNLIWSISFLVAWLAYGLLLSGFPYVSEKAAAVARLTRGFLLFWTVSRLVASVASFVFSSPSLVDHFSDVGDWLFPFVLVVVFIFFDLLPCTLSFVAPFFDILLGVGSLATASAASVSPTFREQDDASNISASPRDLLLTVEDREVGARGVTQEEGDEQGGLGSSINGFQTARSTQSAQEGGARTAYRALSGFWHKWAGTATATYPGALVSTVSTATEEDGRSSGSDAYRPSRKPQPSIPELF